VVAGVPAESRRRAAAALAAAATAVLVGAGIVATRFVLDQTGPVTLAFWRYAIGATLLLPVALRTARLRFERRDLLPIALLGVTQFGVVIVLLNLALAFTTSARAALIFATLPLLAMVLTALLGQERLTLATASGVALTIAGVALVLGTETLTQPGAVPRAWRGEALALASTFAAALCSVLYRPYLLRYPTVSVSAFAMLASVAALAVAAVPEGLLLAPPAFTGAGWLAVAFIGVASSVGYFLWLWALRHAGATRVSTFMALSPLTAAALGALLLAEPAPPTIFVGALVIALGLRLAQRRPVVAPP
jgi:drug/metabolite transporter (DMT)-like permease